MAVEGELHNDRCPWCVSIAGEIGKHVGIIAQRLIHGDVGH